VRFLFSGQRDKSQPCIVIGNKKLPLRNSLRLNRALWGNANGRAIDDVDDDHAELFQATDGAWEVRLLSGDYMFVDGRRSRHNRLRSGAVVALGQSQRAAFQFLGP
jgi:hypothetical protein